MINALITFIFFISSTVWGFDFAIPPENYKLKNNYNYVDQAHLIRPAKLIEALKYYEFNLSQLENSDSMTLNDFSLHASKQRLFLINMKTGDVEPMLVAVGHGSDPDGDGFATLFSNIDDTHQSSLGFYLTDDVYDGKNGRSLRLHGLSDTNSNAYDRAIVIHGAPYVLEDLQLAGRSFGCPAVDFKNRDHLIDATKGFSLLYIFH